MMSGTTSKWSTRTMNGPTETADDLLGDELHAVAVTDLADVGQVAGR
jgi:hypothetical protein